MDQPRKKSCYVTVICSSVCLLLLHSCMTPKPQFWIPLKLSWICEHRSAYFNIMHLHFAHTAHLWERFEVLVDVLVTFEASGIDTVCFPRGADVSKDRDAFVLGVKQKTCNISNDVSEESTASSFKFQGWLQLWHFKRGPDTPTLRFEYKTYCSGRISLPDELTWSFYVCLNLFRFHYKCTLCFCFFSFVGIKTHSVRRLLFARIYPLCDVIRLLVAYPQGE